MCWIVVNAFIISPVESVAMLGAHPAGHTDIPAVSRQGHDQQAITDSRAVRLTQVRERHLGLYEASPGPASEKFSREPFAVPVSGAELQQYVDWSQVK